MQKLISDEELLQLSRQTRVAADDFLVETSVMKVLSKVGLPMLIGSYTLDLMIDADIDIVVETKSLKGSAVKALDEFVELEVVQKYELGDFIKFPRIGRPKGYILNLKSEYAQANWEIEIWFLKDKSFYERQLLRYKSQLTFQSRIEILRKKYERRRAGISKHELSSKEIYDGVLNKEQG